MINESIAQNVEQLKIEYHWENVPQEMKERKQWVLWKRELNEKGKLTKILYRLNGRKADSTNPATWETFEKVVNAYKEQSGKYSGIGFVFSESDPYTATDIDKCVHDGVISDEAQLIIQTQWTYTEYSPSGIGFHTISKANMPTEKGGRKSAKGEMYSRARFFTITGNVPKELGTPLTIEENQEGINKTYALMFPDNPEVNEKPRANAITQTLDLSDQKIIDIALNAKNGAKFFSLYNGQWEGLGYPSRSEADLAFCNILAFYTKDFNQIDRIFTASGLYNKKWDRNDYKFTTINKALSGVVDTYSGKTQRANTGGKELIPMVPKIPSPLDKWKDALRKTDYGVNNSGFLCYTKFGQDGEKELVPIANFLARPLREVVKDNGVETKTVFEIEGILSTGRSLPPVIVPADSFTSMNWVVKEWGLGANVKPGNSNKDKVRHAIQSLAIDIPRETVFTHLGWRNIDGTWVYLHADGAINGTGLSVDLKEEGLARYKFPERNDIRAAVKQSLKIFDVAPRKVTLALYGLVYLAPLCEPLRMAGIEPSFVAWLIGLTGSKKSTLAGLFLSHFGDFTGKTLPGSFKDTANALEKKAFLTKDSLFVIDDYHPTSSTKEASTMEANAQQILRAYGDRVGRTRMKSDTTLRVAYQPRGLCLVTGEDAPTAGQSTTARYISIELTKDCVDTNVLTELQKSTDSLSQTMRSYIESINVETLPEKLYEMFVKLRERATVEGQHARIPETIAWLQIGVGMGLTHALGHGAINQAEKEQILKESWEALLQLAESQAKSIEGERPTQQFLGALSEMLTSGKIYTRYISDEGGVSEDFIGWYDANTFYLLPGTTYNAVTKFFANRNAHIAVSEKTLWKQLEQENTLIPGTEGRTVKKTFGGGKRQRVIQIPKWALEFEEE